MRKYLFAITAYAFFTSILTACVDSKSDLIEDAELVNLLAINASNPVSLYTLHTSLTADGEGRNRKLSLEFNPLVSKAALKLKPEKPWDWSQFGDINLAFDATNKTNRSINLYVQLIDENGWPHARSISVAPNSTHTYYAVLNGEPLSGDTGLRELPETWPDLGRRMHWMWGNKQLSLDQIRGVQFFVDPFAGNGLGNASDLPKDSPEGKLEINNAKRLTIKNIRLRRNPEFDSKSLEKMVDAYGQRTNFKSRHRINSDQQLREQANAEQLKLANEGPMSNRTKFGGWQSGPQLQASGFFRTTKHKGKWALVDPSGKLFFSSAISNIRVKNTSTLTGIDYDRRSNANKLKLKTSDQQASSEVKPLPRVTTSGIRRKMFNWLPSADHPLANHYDYQSKVKEGPLEHGETFSFYSANLERKYGQTYPESYLNNWQETTVNRMRNWGFTSFGNWVDARFYEAQAIPFFASTWIAGDFKKLSTSPSRQADLPDPFDPRFAFHAEMALQKVSEKIKNNPWCIGIFVDNAKLWGKADDEQKRHGVALTTLMLNDSESPTKTEFTKLLKNKYSSIDALNFVWGSSYDSWQTISKGIKVEKINDRNREDFELLSYHFARQYFYIVRQNFDKAFPNHLYFGLPFTNWGMTEDVIRAASEFVDVLSFKYYREGLHKQYWSFLEKIDKPSLITEFHIGATSDTGMLHPGLIQASDQKERARMYQAYMRSVIENPFMVGAHWFQYIDSPLTGRAYDGENYNTGFVNVTDTPYPELVRAAKEVNRQLYERKYTH